MFTLNSFSQIEEAVKEISQPDLNTLFEHYFEPISQSASYGLNNGWYHTAKTHKKFGFDITISLNAASTPSSKRFFKFIESEYSGYISPNGVTELPTAMGKDDETQMNIFVPENSLEYNGVPVKNPEITGTFDMFGGIGDDLPLKAIPTPTVQVGLGLPKTDIKVRYMPEIEVEGVSTNLIGLGLQHDLMQYLGPLEKLPLNVSILGAFTNFSVAYTFDDSPINGNNQSAEYSIKAYTFQAIASLDFPVITIYGALGYNIANSSFDMLGEYEIEYVVDTNPNPTEVTITYTNPVKADFKANGVRATLGTRLNLGPFKMFGDYTLQKYNTLSVGIALSFR